MERKEKQEEKASKNPSPTKEEEEEEKPKIMTIINKKSNNNLPNIPQEEFAFGSCGSEMCAADEVFFGGKILPFQPRPANHPKPNTAAQLAPRQQRSVRNRFHAHPSPKPHVSFERASSRRVKQSASVWDFFKVGLVRTPPELESQEPNYNLRSNSRRKGVSRSSSGSNSDNVNAKSPTTTTKMKLLSGCTCSADSVASDSIVNSLIVTKLEEVLLLEKKKSSSGRRSDDDCYYYYNYDYNCNYYKDDDNRKPKKQGVVMRSRKQTASNHRTYEWLNELSRANLPPMHV